MKQMKMMLVVLLLVAVAGSCRKKDNDMDDNINPPVVQVAVDNPDNPDDVFGVYHNKGMDYIKSRYTLTGSYTFAEGQEQIIQLVKKWADEMVNDAAFVAYCGADKKVIQQEVILATDSMVRRPDFFSNPPIIEKEVKMEMMSHVPQDEAIKMGPFIDFSLDKLDSLVKKLDSGPNYYKGIKVIEKDYMAISNNATGRRYFTLFRYSAHWVESNMEKEQDALKWRVIVADIRGGGAQWLAGGSVADIVLGAITASANAAFNRGKI